MKLRNRGLQNDVKLFFAMKKFTTKVIKNKDFERFGHLQVSLPTETTQRYNNMAVCS